MSIKPIKTADGIKLKNTKTGKLAGAVSTKGKSAPKSSSRNPKVSAEESRLALVAHAKQDVLIAEQEYLMAVKEEDIAGKALDRLMGPRNSSMGKQLTRAYSLAKREYKLSVKNLDKAKNKVAKLEALDLKVGDVVELEYVNYDYNRERNTLSDFDALIDEPLLAEIRSGKTPSQDEDFAKPWMLIEIKVVKRA